MAAGIAEAGIDPECDRIFVTKVPQGITKDDIANHFNQFGPTTDVYVPQVPGMPGHKGIAFVSFSLASTVPLVIHSAPHEINGMEVVVDVAAPRQAKGKGGFGKGGPMGGKGAPGFQGGYHQHGGGYQGGAHGGFQGGPHGGFQGGPHGGFQGGPHGGHGFQGAAHGGFKGQPHGGQGFNGQGGCQGFQPGMQEAPMAPGVYSHQLPGMEGHGVNPSPHPDGADGDRLFVTKVPPTLNRQHLTEYFGQFGELTDVYVPQIPGSAGHKGIAFISFADPTTLHTVLQSAPHEICGLPVVVDVAAPRGAQVNGGKGGFPGPQGQMGGGQGLARRPPWEMGGPHGQGFGQKGFQPPPPAFDAYGHQQFGGKGAGAPPAPPAGNAVPGRLFLTKVAPDIQKVDLELYFGQFGPLADVFIPAGKGIAFVSFTDPSHALLALEHQQHTVKPGSMVVVDQAIDRPPLGGKGKAKGKGAWDGGWQKGGFAAY